MVRTTPEFWHKGQIGRPAGPEAITTTFLQKGQAERGGGSCMAWPMFRDYFRLIASFFVRRGSG